MMCMNNKILFVLWFLSSDHLEQDFAHIRTGMYAGRRTAMDASWLVCGLENRNTAMELFGFTTLERFIRAHTRGKAVIDP